jgi:hypothetical protein
MKQIIGMMALALLCGCQQRTAQNASNVEGTAPALPNAAQSAPPANEAANAASADRVSPPLAEPKGTIDPKSGEAAGQVVQHYGALIEQDRWPEAAKYWGDADAASAFAKQLQSRQLKHLEIGALGESEGAAGSIYITMPVSFYGGSSRAAADVILRRVNDVPGSTEAQRRWHIERIEWKA